MLDDERKQIDALAQEEQSQLASNFATQLQLR